MKAIAAVSASLIGGAMAGNGLARTPPMGWMSWEVFRCNLEAPGDDCSDPTSTKCISEALYVGQTDALVANGFLAAGYNSIHADDCWPAWQRDPSSGQLVANSTRFPKGMKYLGDYMHAKNVQWALYTAESTETCAGYPASLGKETLDANTMASWGVDYLKVDGCGSLNNYPKGYADMGAALQASGRPIVYSCSWPAYIGDNETQKNFTQYIADGCNLWRNWDDIQCGWDSLSSIIEHWGTYGKYLAQFAGPGHWHDPDMLLIGNDCVTTDEERTQMAIWSIVAAPLIMGNDLRNVSASGKAILMNAEAIAVDQDPAGIMGYRLSPAGPTEVWARPLFGGDVAVGLYNKLGTNAPPKPQPCPSWNKTTDGYMEACGGGGGNIACFGPVGVDEALTTCCNNPQCAGFSYDASQQSGCYKTNTDCGFVSNGAYEGFYKPNFAPPVCGPQDVTVNLLLLGFTGNVKVRDIWAGADLGTFSGTFTAKAVPCHGTGFFRMSPA